jgi:hypothetical protein
LLGEIRYVITYGKFLSSKKMEFMDYHHFNGNLTFFGDFSLNDFELLDYYRYSTNDEYIEAHGEFNMGGLILNKIPFIRRLKLNEIVSAHYFHTPFVNNYVETSFGVEYLRAIRADFVFGFNNNNKAITGFVIHLNLGSARRALDLLD